MADSDNDFGGSAELGQRGNTSRRLDDWEEINGRTKYIIPKNGFDDDGDGVIDEWEGEYRVFPPTNATNPDSDLDGWLDVDEIFGIDTSLLHSSSTFGVLRTDPTLQDSDQDGLDDLEELKWIRYYHEYLTDPTDPDTDDDSMTDWTEWNTDFFPYINWDHSDDPWAYSTHSRSDCEIDWNGDFSKFYIDKTNPTKWDTDGDGLPDGWECRFGWITITEENITKFDLEERERIYCEKWMIGTNYIMGLPYGTKIWLVNPLIGADPYDDPDRDGLTNLEEYQHRTHPLKADTDGDGMPDGWELDPWNRYKPMYDQVSRRYKWTLDPLDPNDWYLDPDHDGVVVSQWSLSQEETGRYHRKDYYFPWVNLYEYLFGEDIDNDGINEITTSPAPRVTYLPYLGGYDSDSNGIPDGHQFFWEDSDNDSLPTGWELFYNGTLWHEPETRPYVDRGVLWNWFDHSMKFTEEQLAVYDIDLTLGALYPDRKDTNIDGVNDTWEDHDGDGFDNWEEFYHGTDPTDISSFPDSPYFIADDSRRSRS